jgi:hypothetical protein
MRASFTELIAYGKEDWRSNNYEWSERKFEHRVIFDSTSKCFKDSWLLSKELKEENAWCWGSEMHWNAD